MLAAKAHLEPVVTTLVNKIPFDSQYKYMRPTTRLAVRSRF
ncbi:hypothetical protein ACVXG7_08995 [Enterobacter hormaechei]